MLNGTILVLFVKVSSVPIGKFWSSLNMALWRSLAPTTRLTAASLLLFIALTPHALASSADAWDAFKEEIQKACREAAARSATVADVIPDPFGSEDHGMAVVYVAEPGVSIAKMMVCTYSKETKIAQAGSILEIPVMGPHLPRQD